jgi:environmental stress-induced protein Ves
MNQMQITVLNKKDYRKSKWKGGTSTELFIYPPQASFQERNFQLRISKAKVKQPNSTFTTLPNYHRLLHLLKGTFLLNHTSVGTNLVLPGDTILFEGSWETHCKGVGSDFNLMYSGKGNGNIVSHIVLAGDYLSLQTAELGQLNFIYLLAGEVNLLLCNQEFKLKKSHSLVAFDQEILSSLIIEAGKDTQLILVSYSDL